MHSGCFLLAPTNRAASRTRTCDSVMTSENSACRRDRRSIDRILQKHRLLVGFTPPDTQKHKEELRMGRSAPFPHPRSRLETGPEDS
jgi:hypothetical protein